MTTDIDIVKNALDAKGYVIRLIMSKNDSGRDIFTYALFNKKLLKEITSKLGADSLDVERHGSILLQGRGIPTLKHAEKALRVFEEEFLVV
ncbi:hypothetical protein N9W34_01375 [Rickettsiales bacterium]|nr:hypothetical protein [Rickettsiales bacterium]